MPIAGAGYEEVRIFVARPFGELTEEKDESLQGYARSLAKETYTVWHHFRKEDPLQIEKALGLSKKAIAAAHETHIFFDPNFSDLDVELGTIPCEHMCLINRLDAENASNGESFVKHLLGKDDEYHRRDRMTPREREIALIVRKNLQKSFPLYRPSNSVKVHTNEFGEIAIDYNIALHFLPESTKCQFNIRDDRGIVNYIFRSYAHRGKGYGRKLYLAFEQLARELGCKTITADPHDREVRVRYWESLDFIMGHFGRMTKFL